MNMIKFRLNGIAPILMHSDRGMNFILDPLAREFKQLTVKKKKTDEDYGRISEVEWELGMYFDDDVGPFVPGINVEACIRDGAKLERRGEDVKKAVHVFEDKIPLQYKGPRSLEGLWKGGFRDTRTVGNQNNRVMRCRPRFNEWSVEFCVNFDPNIFNRDDLIRCVELGGKYCGLCDFTPRFGRFEVEAI